MPNSPKTPTRTMRVSDVLWKSAQAKAAAEGRTITSVIIKALEAYVSDLPEESSKE
jgi:predicted HicB family RNase H-like nuclease